MLLWEALRSLNKAKAKPAATPDNGPLRCARLPYDKRCAATTKAGHRCKCRIRQGLETCLFHDPTWRAEMRRRMSERGIVRRRRLSQLPDGYLRKLTTRSSVADAFDRLYREIRLGIVTPAMGQVLFTVLSRILDSGLLDEAKGLKRPVRVTRAERGRINVRELLTRAERSAWRKAVADAPESLLLAQQPGMLPLMLPPPRPATVETTTKPEPARSRQAAS